MEWVLRRQKRFAVLITEGEASDTVADDILSKLHHAENGVIEFKLSRYFETNFNADGSTIIYGGFDIKRNDGVTGTIVSVDALEDDTSFWMIVWDYQKFT
uniref:FBA_2 domain-containing protein n=1 Tax=Caenorhabditis tropicalis TaxID=1561998 RepID=A0A1I7UA06_9PELO